MHSILKCTIRFSLLTLLYDLIYSSSARKGSLIFVDLSSTRYTVCWNETRKVIAYKKNIDSYIRSNGLICNIVTRNLFFYSFSLLLLSKNQTQRVKDRRQGVKENINCMINWNSGYATCYISLHGVRRVYYIYVFPST